jgi:hypothetical protein
MMEVREARRAQTTAYALPSESAGAGSTSDSSRDSSSSSFLIVAAPPPPSLHCRPPLAT